MYLSCMWGPNCGPLSNLFLKYLYMLEPFFTQTVMGSNHFCWAKIAKGQLDSLKDPDCEIQQHLRVKKKYIKQTMLMLIVRFQATDSYEEGNTLLVTYTQQCAMKFAFDGSFLRSSGKPQVVVTKTKNLFNSLIYMLNFSQTRLKRHTKKKSLPLCLLRGPITKIWKLGKPPSKCNSYQPKSVLNLNT